MPGEEALIGAGLDLAGNVAGYALSQEDRKRQRDMLAKMLEDWDMQVPELQNVQGQQLGPSGLASYNSDPELLAAQRQALQGMLRAGNGELSLEDRAAMEEAGNNQRQASEGARSRIMSDLQARGVGRSGLGAATAMQASAQGSEQAHRAQRDAMAAAQRRGLESLSRAGSMAGQAREQDFGEASRKAQAADQIAQWNASSRDRANYHNAGNPERQFAMQSQLARGRSGAREAVAGGYGASADATQRMFSGSGNAAGRAVRGYGRSQDLEKDPYGGYGGY